MLNGDRFPPVDELVRRIKNGDVRGPPPPTTSGEGNKRTIARARIGKPREGKIVDRLSHEDGRKAEVVYDLEGNILHMEGDEDLLEHFEPGEGMDEYLQRRGGHFEQVRDEMLDGRDA